MSTVSLTEAFRQNPHLHAYLYISSNASLRKEGARLIAKSMLCRNTKEGAEPCGECDCCVKMNAQAHPDCIVIGGEKVGVDDIRGIEEEAYLAPNEADLKVFVLENADGYNIQSQNALLKIIEEPPRGVRFVLTASSKNALLETVRSRVCVLSGEIIGIEHICKEIKDIKRGLSDTETERIAHFVSEYDKTDIKNLDEKLLLDYIEKAGGFFSGKTQGAPLPLPKKKDEFMLWLQVFMLASKEIALAKCKGRLREGMLSSETLSVCNSKTSMKKAHALYDTFEEAYLLLEANANVNAVSAFLLQSVK